MKFLSTCAVACLAVQALSAALSHKLYDCTITEHPDPVKRALSQKHARLGLVPCGLPQLY